VSTLKAEETAVVRQQFGKNIPAAKKYRRNNRTVGIDVFNAVRVI
jgi:hypothetical protein